MASLSERFRTAVFEAELALRALAEPVVATRSDGGEGWSRKQELGHLIDSAANNRARFINAALAGQYAGPSYDGDGWVELGGYAGMDRTEVVGLWAALNRALATVVERIPAERLSAPCRIGDAEPVTLEFVIEDYLRHMRHHLDHIVSR
jgi:hypothetical protein